MPAQYKVDEVKKLVSKLENAKAVVFVDYKGITVN
ncbi:50S ribosomal protein L10, partial [Sneathia sanguinegens]